MNDADGFRIEAAEQFGFEEIDGQDAPGQEGYFCTETELIAFAKACERKGMAEAKAIAADIKDNRNVAHFLRDFQAGFKHGAFVVAHRLNEKITEIDAELNHAEPAQS